MLEYPWESVTVSLSRIGLRRVASDFDGREKAVRL